MTNLRHFRRGQNGLVESNLTRKEPEMGLDGPSVPVRVEPLKTPQPEPVHAPATPEPVKPDKVPA